MKAGPKGTLSHTVAAPIKVDRTEEGTIGPVMQAIELARRLVSLAPEGLGKVFYAENGASAVEIALKMAFQYWQQQRSESTRKTRFVSLRHAYHGDTVGFCPCAPGCIRFMTTEGQSVCVLQFNRGPFQSCSSSSECPDEFPITFPTCAPLVGDTAGNICTHFARLC